MMVAEWNQMFISFVIPGRPIPKGRPRAGSGRIYTPKRTADYEALVGWTARRDMDGRKMLSGPVGLRVLLGFPVPTRTPKKRYEEMLSSPCMAKEDVDNCLKGIADAMNGVVYEDDRQIVKALVEKHWTLPGEERAIVQVFDLSQ